MYPDPDRPRTVGAIDVVIILAVVAAGYYLWSNVANVLVYKWSWDFVPGVLFTQNPETGWWRPNLLLEGLLTTIKLSVWSMLIACVLGLLLGTMATRIRLLPRLTALAYVGLIRNVPPLVFIFVFYFFISSQLVPLLGIDSWVRELGDQGRGIMSVLLGPPELLENLISGVICLAMYEAAYISELVRAGIRSVPKGQSEAAVTVGLGPWQSFRYVVMPQALRAVMPPMANQFILLIKNSSIVSLISVQELTFTGSEIAVSTGRRFETWILVALMYFLLCYGLAQLFAYWERRSRAQFG